MMSPVDGTSARSLLRGASAAPARSSPAAGNQVRARCRLRVADRTRLVRVVASSAVLVGLALLMVYQYAEIARVGYRLAAVQREAERLDKENELLRVTVAQLESPARIDAIARTRLGMVQPQQFALASVPVPTQTVEAPPPPARPVLAKPVSGGFWVGLGRLIFQAVAGPRAVEAHPER